MENHKIPDRLQLKKVTPEELKNILEAHQLWSASKGEKGERANLQGVDLRQANLEGANLEQALLGESDLQGAKLYKANLRNSDLSQTNFHNADLRYTDFTGAKNLQVEQLSGANLSNAKVPENIVQFNGLKNIEESSKNAKRIFFLLIFSCVYSWLTMGTTTIPNLITNSPVSRLPIISVPIHIVSFFMWTPAIILCIYLYYQIVMQRLWELLSIMPAVFPDGEPLDRKVYPWLLTGLVKSYFKNLKTNKRLRFFGLQKLLSIFSAWFIVPLTLYLFWGNYLYRHEIIGTIWLLILFTISVVFSIISLCVARRTLSGDRNSFRLVGLASITILLCCVTLFPISIGFIYGLPSRFAPEMGDTDIRILIPHIFRKIGINTGAPLEESDLSIVPTNWTGKDIQELDYVKGARLNGANLRYAFALRCFLVKADLRYADIKGAIFFGADLRKANLMGANLNRTQLSYGDLRWANFRRAKLLYSMLDHANFDSADFDFSDLKGTDLISSNLQNATMKEANLQEAKLAGANLKGANLASSSLRNANLGPFPVDPFKVPNLIPKMFNIYAGGANLQGTNLTNADMQGAILIGVQGLTKDQIKKAKNFFLAYYDDKIIKLLGLPKDHNIMIRSKNLIGLNLRGMTLFGIDLSGFDLENADFRNTNFLKEYSMREHLFHQTTFQGANLKNADLRKADFQGANLKNANFEGAKLKGAKLQGADLTGAMGLTRKQVESAITDESTKLPRGLN